MEVEDFNHVSSFEEVIELAKDKVRVFEQGYALNFSLKVSFDIGLVKTPQFLDAEKLAEDFQRIKKPESLYLNHGEYITADGIPHVIHELKNKHTGNRALISLINQRNIIGSGDVPIPSFIIMQFSLEGDALYVTTYFRALEVAKFLRINLEEIRLVVKSIYDAIHSINTIRLHVFAFRAYIKENFNPLMRPRVELLDDIQLLKLMEKRPKELSSLLREKLTASTVIENESLKVMQEIVSDNNKNQELKPCFSTEYTRGKIQECVELSNRLIEMRRAASHIRDIDEVNNEYLKALNELIEEIEKCD